MTNRDQVLALFTSGHVVEVTNSEIEELTGISPHQQVFQITQALVAEGLLRGRRHGTEWYFSLASQAGSSSGPVPRQTAPASSPYYPFCIYTIRHTQELTAVYQGGGAGTFTEKKKWKSGLELLLAARQAGQKLLVVFAPAEAVTGLIYYAILKDIQFREDGVAAFTDYNFTELTPILPSPLINSLVLMESGRPLSENFIRPYAICHTPEFLVVDQMIQADLEGLTGEEAPPAPVTGAVSRTTQRLSNYYERKPALRAAAVRIHGTQCMVCGFDYQAA